MRFNEHALKQLSRQDGCDREGRLYYKGIALRDSYKERWFRLTGNLLFYYKTNDRGRRSDVEAVGVLVLEKFSVQMEPIADKPFVFSILFDNDGGRRHYFSGLSIQNCLDWITEIKSASYTHMKHKMRTLQARIMSITGKDPLQAMEPDIHISPRRYLSTRKRNSIDIGCMMKSHTLLPPRPVAPAPSMQRAQSAAGIHTTPAEAAPSMKRVQSATVFQGVLLNPGNLAEDVDWNHFG